MNGWAVMAAFQAKLPARRPLCSGPRVELQETIGSTDLRPEGQDPLLNRVQTQESYKKPEYEFHNEPNVLIRKRQLYCHINSECIKEQTTIQQYICTKMGVETPQVLW